VIRHLRVSRLGPGLRSSDQKGNSQEEKSKVRGIRTWAKEGENRGTSKFQLTLNSERAEQYSAETSGVGSTLRVDF